MQYRVASDSPSPIERVLTMSSEDHGPFRLSRSAIIELALAMGGFGIGTGEFATMGLLPNVAGDVGVSIPDAGHIISAYAIGVVIGAPVLAVLGAKLPRRTLLLGLMGLFALGNIASAFASNFPTLLLLRFMTGFPHGTYFGVASLVVTSMTTPDKRAQAVGRMMLGLTIATVFGTPFATWFGQTLGWRAAFFTVGGIGALTVALIAAYVPHDEPAAGSSPLRELGALGNRAVWLTLAIAAVGSGGMFAIYSYITPTLTEVSHVPLHLVPIVLALFGVGMIIGNIVGPLIADRALMPTIGGMLLWDCAVQGLLWFTAPHAWMAITNIVLIGTGFAIVPALQTRLMDVAKDAQTLAAALNHSAFNIANALGAWVGGLTIAAGFGWASTGWVGSCFTVLGMIFFGLSLFSDSRSRATVAAAAE